MFPWTYGALAAVCVGVTGNRRLILGAVVVVPLLGGAAILLHGHPVAGGVFFGSVVALSGLAARTRLENQVRMVPLTPSVLVTFPPDDGLGDGPALDALVAVGISLVAIVWTLVLVVRPILRRVPPIAPPTDRTDRVADVSAVVVGVASGIAA